MRRIPKSLNLPRSDGVTASSKMTAGYHNQLMNSPELANWDTPGDRNVRNYGGCARRKESLHKGDRGYLNKCVLAQ